MRIFIGKLAQVQIASLFSNSVEAQTAWNIEECFQFYRRNVVQFWYTVVLPQRSLNWKRRFAFSPSSLRC